MNEIEGRVQREKSEHDDNSILEKSFKVKNIFCHCLYSPTMKRLENDEMKIFKGCKGLKVLDVGCGFGERSVLLAKYGAQVTGIDISSKYIKSSKKLSQEEGVPEKCIFEEMDVHDMNYLDETFDLVVGRGIIHHLDLKVSLLEIKRVLKKGGSALFMEPLDANPLLKILRFLTPFARTPDEKPLTKKDLRWVAKNFYVKSTFYGILSAPVAIMTSLFLRPYPSNVFLKLSDFVERYINKIKILHPYNQYVLLNVKK